MLLIMTVIFILPSTFIGASGMKDDSKTGYFIVATIIYVGLAIISFCFIY